MAKDISLPLDRVLHWETARADEVYLTQPMGNGQRADYTWRRAVGEARRMASYLKSLDLPPKSRVAIVSKNCAHWIMSDWAIWMAGHVSVPLYPTLNADTVSYILEHSGAAVAFIGKLDDWEMMKSGVPEDLPCIAYPVSPKTDFPIWDDLVAKYPPLQEIEPRDPEELATIVYTSGSTGMPKGVMLSFENMAYAAEGGIQALAITANERMLSYLPLAHVFERFVVEMGSLYAGFHVYFAESLNTFVADLKTARPTIFLAVPRIWTKFQAGVFQKMPPAKLERLLKVPLLNRIIRKKVLSNLGLEHVRFAGSGSAPLSGDIMDWYRGLGLELLEGYGMSENFAYSHLSLPGRSRTGYVGEPLPGVETRIAEGGEVQVKSPATMMGYYRDPHKTTETFTDDGFIRTGDKGEEDELKRLKLTGRIKEIFKTSKGKYVAPAPIENILVASPWLEMACVSGANYTSPFAMVMLSEDAQAKSADPQFRQDLELEIRALMEKLNEQVDPHERLKFVVVMRDQWTIENDFLTPTMKLKRNVVEGAYQDQVDRWYESGEALIWQ